MAEASLPGYVSLNALSLQNKYDTVFACSAGRRSNFYLAWFLEEDTIFNRLHGFIGIPLLCIMIRIYYVRQICNLVSIIVYLMLIAMCM